MSGAGISWCRSAGLACCAVFMLATFAVCLAGRRALLARGLRAYTNLLDARLRSAGLRASGSRIARAQLSVGVTTLLVAVAIGQPAWWLPVALSATIPSLALARMRQRRTALLERQLDGFLVTLSNALRVTPNVVSALSSLPPLLPAPVREEVELVNRELRLGSSLDGALLGMSRRVGSPALDAALTALLIGRRLGGDLPGILGTTAAALREVCRLEGVVRARTSQARAQLWVLAISPFGIVALLGAASPGYFEPLQHSVVGGAVALGAGLLWLAALALARNVLAVRP